MITSGWKGKLRKSKPITNRAPPACNRRTTWKPPIGRRVARATMGYVANLTETCDAKNQLQLIIKVQLAPNQFDCCPSAKDKDLERIEYASVKPKAREVPTIRGYRHTLDTDSVLGPHGWNVEKAPVHAVVASVLGSPPIEVASGPEHQGPPGSTGLAIIAKAT